MKSYRAFVYAVILLAATSRAKSPPLSTQVEIPPHLGYGINLRYLSNIDSIVAPLNFDWIKVYEKFDSMPTKQLPYHVLYRIDINNAKQRWSWQNDRLRPNLDKIRADMREIALEGLGVVNAYEIGNEMNMAWEWEGQPPDPADYVAVLQVAYETIKELDPDAIVVSGGLGPVGRIQGACTANSGETYPLGNNCHAMDEREYAREMFRRGAGDYFDAFGYHPCGYAYEPERALEDLPSHDNGNGFAFRGAEVIRDIMVEYDLADKPIWATEFGWLRDPSEDGFSWCHDDPIFAYSYEWYDLPEVTQANYLTRAFQYADENWPWMGAMFIWALDFHQQGAECWHGRYFSIRKYNDTPEGAPTLAYSALITMTKHPGHFGPKLVVEPANFTFLKDVEDPDVFTATLHVRNAGYRELAWTATVAAGMQVTPTLAITTGLQGKPLTVTVDSAGYPAGDLTGAITITATTTDVLGSPQTVPITLSIVPRNPRLVVIPPTLTLLADVDESNVFTKAMIPTNTGHGVLTWTATVATGMQVTPTLAPTTGFQGEPLTVTVDSAGYTTGVFTGIITVTATPTDVLDTPQTVPVRLLVVPEVRYVFLPVTFRAIP